MKIAILGSRGIPARYSGYDTLAEELSVGLVKSGAAEVLVYCRSTYYTDQPASWHGVRLVYLPAPRIKALESLLHSFLSALHVLNQQVDVVYFLDPANVPFSALLSLLGKKVVVHTDGLGWRRRKWGRLARRYYKFVEWLAARTAHALVTDNPAMQAYYLDEYAASSVYIAYGAESRYGTDRSVLRDLNVTFGEYLLVVARLEPENNTDFVIEEYCNSMVDMPLVVVGDSPYNPLFAAYLRSLSNNNVVFAGRVDDQPKLNALYEGAHLYIHGHEVGGTNPSLLRAMAAGTAPLVLNAPFNEAVIADAGFIFEKRTGHLTATLRHLMTSPSEVSRIAGRASARAARYFTWDSVVAKHAQLFRGLNCEQSTMSKSARNGVRN
jgi:glycosyltransferase involved in cell wall biosynthesis